MIVRFKQVAVACTLAVASLTASAQPAPYGTNINLADASRCLSAVEAESSRNAFSMAIAVVDTGGHLVAFRKMDNTQIGSVRVSIDKAASAVNFRRPTKAFEEALAGGRQAILALPGALPVEGGVPITVEGRIIGAVGVSGGTSVQDGQMAKFCVDALTR